jgi:hypothetical protein
MQGLMKMKRLNALALGVSTVLAASAAGAATLEFTGAPDVINSVSGFNPSPDVTLDTPITAYSTVADNTLGGGVNLTLASGERATISYTVVGQESGFFNYLVVEGVNIPETATGLTTLASMTASGLLDFGFASNRQFGTDAGPTLAIINGGLSEVSSYKLGFGTIEQTAGGFSVTAYFGDGTGDSDFDDIVAQIDVAISVVPVPAGALLLGTGLIGFGALRRHRRKNT